MSVHHDTLLDQKLLSSLLIGHVHGLICAAYIMLARVAPLQLLSSHLLLLKEDDTLDLKIVAMSESDIDVG